MDAIGREINLLIGLQKLDMQIYKFNRSKDDIPILIQRLDEDHKKKTETLRQKEDELKSLLVRQKDKENELASKEETIRKCQSQLYQIKTNKEYSAMQQEIKGHEADKSVLEDEIIAILDEVEAKKKLIEGEKLKLKEEEKKVASEKDRLNQELKKIEEKLNLLSTQRVELTSKINKEILNKYEKILKGKNGLAMVPVQDNACGGCHLNLPPQVINEIYMKKDLVFCESCSRILYIEDGDK